MTKARTYLAGALGKATEIVDASRPEAWSPDMYYMGRRLKGLLETKLVEVHDAAMLAAARPCAHCDWLVAQNPFGRHPAEAAPDADWWHVDSTGGATTVGRFVGGEWHVAEPMTSPPP